MAQQVGAKYGRFAYDVFEHGEDWRRFRFKRFGFPKRYISIASIANGVTNRFLHSIIWRKCKLESWGRFTGCGGSLGLVVVTQVRRCFTQPTRAQVKPRKSGN
jgi:hypothetical protein